MQKLFGDAIERSASKEWGNHGKRVGAVWGYHFHFTDEHVQRGASCIWGWSSWWWPNDFEMWTLSAGIVSPVREHNPHTCHLSLSFSLCFWVANSNGSHARPYLSRFTCWGRGGGGGSTFDVFSIISHIEYFIGLQVSFPNQSVGRNCDTSSLVCCLELAKNQPPYYFFSYVIFIGKEKLATTQNSTKNIKPYLLKLTSNVSFDTYFRYLIITLDLD